jgi:hypothetical protein
LLYEAENSISDRKVHFVHRYCTNNTGDLACGYYQYFAKEFSEFTCFIHDINFIHFSLIAPDDVVIIGGGGLINSNVEWNYNINKTLMLNNNTIIWSAGFNSHFDNQFRSALKFDLLKLISVRDLNYGKFRYVPCASCMIPELDFSYNITRDVGLIMHKDNFSEVPTEFNNYHSLKNNATALEIVGFIGSSEVIVTNSYHAAYWAILMKKRAIIFAPFSEKFNYYKFKPTLYSGDLQSDIKKSKIYKDSLSDAKFLTKEFALEILSIVKQDI